MNVLVVAAHPDDEVLGCGATMCRHKENEDVVTVLFVGTGRDDAQKASAVFAARELGIDGVRFLGMGLEDQRFDAANRLDIVHAIEGALLELKPETVYTHHAGDRNLDHRIVNDAVLTACRPFPGQSVKNLLTFEVPSSTEWGDGFRPTVFAAISEDASKRKSAALKAYAQELRPHPHPRSFYAIAARENWRGASVGVPQAEAFELIRQVC